MSYSLYSSDILAAVDTDDTGFIPKDVFTELFQETALEHQIVVDSKSLFETLILLHKIEDYCLRKVVTRMRDSFESAELSYIRWFLGPRNYADVLMNRNVFFFGKLNNVLSKIIWLLKQTSFGLHHDKVQAYL